MMSTAARLGSSKGSGRTGKDEDVGQEWDSTWHSASDAQDLELP